MASLHTTRLFRSPILVLDDVRCRPQDGACGAEERTSRPSLAVVRGGLFRKHVGRGEVLADANHAVFFNPDEPYRVSHPVAGGDDCSSFEFAPEVLAEAAASLGYDPADRAPRFRATHMLLPPTACMLEAAARRACLQEEPMAVEEWSLGLLHALCRQVTPRRATPPPVQRAATRRAHRAWVDRARVFLVERYTAAVTLSDVAKAVSCSPFHLARVFRRETGLPLHRHLTRLRLHEAANRLAAGWDDLTSLALELGFSSHAHFSDSFRRTFVCTPSAFRRGLSVRQVRQISKNLKA
jgi:AraC-like DNA-binding protein